MLWCNFSPFLWHSLLWRCGQRKKSYFSLSSSFSDFSGVKLFAGVHIVMMSFEFGESCTKPDKSICKSQSCRIVIASFITNQFSFEPVTQRWKAHHSITRPLIYPYVLFFKVPVVLLNTTCSKYRASFALVNAGTLSIPIACCACEDTEVKYSNNFLHSLAFHEKPSYKPNHMVKSSIILKPLTRNPLLPLTGKWIHSAKWHPGSY